MDNDTKRCNKQKHNEIIDSSSYIICRRAQFDRRHKRTGEASNVEVELVNDQACPKSQSKKNVTLFVDHQLTYSNPIKSYLEPYSQVKVAPPANLKDSTRKLLHLIEDIQSKTYSKDLPLPNTDEIEPPPTALLIGTKISSIFDGTAQALKELEAQTKTLNTIYIQDEDKDCSIFKRLTRKCTCFNRTDYNDLMMHFNEDTKYVTSPIGEIIKNIRIVKKFLYMGGTYTKNALLFLNEAFETSAYAERVEITLGCAHADLCNVFENPTIVTVCISWPQKYSNFADSLTQVLAASFLFKFAKLEEGRRYLKYTTKVTSDIKKILRKQGSKIDEDVIETLKATLNLIVPPTPKDVSLICYSRRNDEGKVKETINGLHQFRQQTLEEVSMHLDLLTNFSHPGTSKTNFKTYLPDLLHLFKKMLKEYDNSKINITITNILNNIVSSLKNNIEKKEKEPEESVTLIVADTATEPIEMMSQITQIPQIPIHGKKPFCKYRQASRRKVQEFEEPAYLNRSRQFNKGILFHTLNVVSGFYGVWQWDRTIETVWWLGKQLQIVAQVSGVGFPPYKMSGSGGAVPTVILVPVEKKTLWKQKEPIL